LDDILRVTHEHKCFLEHSEYQIIEKKQYSYN